MCLPTSGLRSPHQHQSPLALRMARLAGRVESEVLSYPRSVRGGQSCHHATRRKKDERPSQLLQDRPCDLLNPTRLKPFMFALPGRPLCGGAVQLVEASASSVSNAPAAGKVGALGATQAACRVSRRLLVRVCVGRR